MDGTTLTRGPTNSWIVDRLICGPTPTDSWTDRPTLSVNPWFSLSVHWSVGPRVRVRVGPPVSHLLAGMGLRWGPEWLAIVAGFRWGLEWPDKKVSLAGNFKENSLGREVSEKFPWAGKFQRSFPGQGSFREVSLCREASEKIPWAGKFQKSFLSREVEISLGREVSEKISLGREVSEKFSEQESWNFPDFSGQGSWNFPGQESFRVVSLGKGSFRQVFWAGELKFLWPGKFPWAGKLKFPWPEKFQSSFPGQGSFREIFWGGKLKFPWSGKLKFSGKFPWAGKFQRSFPGQGTTEVEISLARKVSE